MCDVIKIGMRLKEARLERGYTQEELGNALGLNKSTVQRYEAGKIEKLKMPVLQAFANQLQINPAWLVLKSNEKDIESYRGTNKPTENSGLEENIVIYHRDGKTNKIKLSKEKMDMFAKMMEAFKDEETDL